MTVLELRSRRQQKGITLEQMAATLGIDRRSLSDIELGKVLPAQEWIDRAWATLDKLTDQAA